MKGVSEQLLPNTLIWYSNSNDSVLLRNGECFIKEIKMNLQDLKYHIFDGETENRPYYGRFSSPWHPDNYMVAHGWKNKGDTDCSYSYQDNKEAPHTWKIPNETEILVGHNLRFDLTWIWHEPTYQAFIRRGGRIWCTQYAEYLLEGHDEEYHMNNLEQLSIKYGGTVKVDAVKAMWNEGKLTSEIPKDLLIDYLVGTKEEERNGGDIGNTEVIYLEQIKRAEELGMKEIIMARMDGYLATTEMEYNGIKVNMQVAVQDMMTDQAKARKLKAELMKMMPDVGIPEQCQFNFGSSQQMSSLLFGGYIKYDWSDNYIDKDTGELARTQVDVVHGYMVDGSLKRLTELSEDNPNVILVKSGKKKGQIKTKKVKLNIGNLKTKRFEKMVVFPRQVTPLAEWKSKAQTDALDIPIYSVGKETIEALTGEDNELAKIFASWKNLTKVLDTYYLKADVKRNKDGTTTAKNTGMLTFVKPNGVINHYLNHTSTVTGRMSAKSPNCQNIPRGDTANVKRMFESRHGSEGVTIEADYSQLEVVVQGYLTKDPNLIRDLLAGVDFHCKRVALKNSISYEVALDYCKVQELPEWKSERTKCKKYTFQREYGGGVALIAKFTGMSEEEVTNLGNAEDAEYALKTRFSEDLKHHLESTSQPYKILFPTGGYKMIQKGQYVSPTGTRFTFRTEDAPAWLRKKGVDQTFKPTKIKNYPTQGTGGEIMQVQLGKLFRKCVDKGWWSGGDNPQALIVNTVHDCVWADCHQDVHKEFGALINETLSSVPETYKELFDVDVGVPFPVDVEYGRNMLQLGHETIRSAMKPSRARRLVDDYGVREFVIKHPEVKDNPFPVEDRKHRMFNTVKQEHATIEDLLHVLGGKPDEKD